jgi:hypothetical protein
LENAVTLDLRVTPFDAPEAVALTEAVQQEYVERYGSPDQTPIEAGEFSPPLGIFVVGWRDGEPITCGGLRVIEPGVVVRPGGPESRGWCCDASKPKLCC